MKLLWIAAPALALGAYLLARALLRRPLSRPIMSALTALLLLGYVLATASLGLFWVARMDLPAFDLHYLFGYCTLLMLAVHLAFQVRPLAATLRRASPRWLSSADGARLLPGVRRSLWALLAALLAVPAVAYLAGRVSTQRSAIVIASSPSSSSSAIAAQKEVWIMRDGAKTRVVDWLYQESRLTRASALAPVVVVEEPAEVKSPAGQPRALPKASSVAGKAFEDLLGEGTGSANSRDPKAPKEGAIVVEEPDAPETELKNLATLLHYAAGVTSRKAESGGLLLRAAASAGALYPTDVYAIAPTLGDGVHYYHPHEHSVFRVATGADPVREALPTQSPARGAPLLFVLAATFDRTGFKYERRAYRYVALDTGHVALNLVLASKTLGLNCVLEPHFDDEALLAAIGGSDKDEGALLVIGCSTRALADRSPHRHPRHDPVELPKSTAGRETARLSHELTSWRLLPGAGTPRTVRSGSSNSRALIKLPRGESSDRDLFDVIAKRRSVRQMTQEKIELSTLGEVLRQAWQGAGRLHAADLVELHVLAQRVKGLARGSYRYDARYHSLVKRGEHAKAAQAAGLDQEVLGLAAAVLVWSYGTDLGKLAGPRDFRVGAFQAGLGGEAAYLAATARNLGVCGVGAFYDDEVAALIGGVASRPLYMVALGPR